MANRRYNPERRAWRGRSYIKGGQQIVALKEMQISAERDSMVLGSTEALMAKLETVITAGIKDYTGEKVTSLALHQDPNVDNTYALRAALGNGTSLDFLLVGGSLKLAHATATQISNLLEEVEYTAWPPNSQG